MSRHPRAISGESITEVLVAILVAGIAAAMVAVAVTTAVSITKRSEHFEQASYASTSQAEALFANPAGTPAGTITVDFNHTNLRSGETSANATAYVTDAGADDSNQEGYEDLLVFVRQGS